MSVRTWVTISIVVLVALSIAFVIRVLQPIRPPELVVRVGARQLDGGEVKSCWQQRDGRERCREQPQRAEELELPASDRMRVIVSYPVQPEAGVVKVLKGAEPVCELLWTDAFDYVLEPGSYTLSTEVRYGDRNYAYYEHAFRVREASSGVRKTSSAEGEGSEAATPGCSAVRDR